MTRTDAVDKVVEESVGEERFRQLPEVHLQSSGGHVDVLPLPVHQVHLLIWTQTQTLQSERNQQTLRAEDAQIRTPLNNLSVCQYNEKLKGLLLTI